MRLASVSLFILSPCSFHFFRLLNGFKLSIIITHIRRDFALPHYYYRFSIPLALSCTWLFVKRAFPTLMRVIEWNSEEEQEEMKEAEKEPMRVRRPISLYTIFSLFDFFLHRYWSKHQFSRHIIHSRLKFPHSLTKQLN